MSKRQQRSGLYNLYDYVVILKEGDFKELKRLVFLTNSRLLTRLLECVRLEGDTYVGELYKDTFCWAVAYVEKYFPESSLRGRLNAIGELQDLYFKEYMYRIKCSPEVLRISRLPFE